MSHPEENIDCKFEISFVLKERTLDFGALQAALENRNFRFRAAKGALLLDATYTETPRLAVHASTSDDGKVTCNTSSKTGTLHCTFPISDGCALKRVQELAEAVQFVLGGRTVRYSDGSRIYTLPATAEK